MEIMEIFQRLNDRGVTILLVTHEMETAEYAKRLVDFRGGAIEGSRVIMNRRLAAEETGR
jgi:putative ABC transport system ATP-binding protein